MKFHSALKESISVPTSNELFSEVPGDINFTSIDNLLYNQLVQAINTILQGLEFVNKSSTDVDFQLSNNEKASIRNGIDKCLKILYEDCYNYYKHSAKEIFLQNANKAIQGFIQHTKLDMEPQASNDLNKNEKEIYAEIKQSELIKTWDLLNLFLANNISKDLLLKDEDILEGFDGTKLDFGMFVLDENQYIDWNRSQELWLKSSKTLITIENYLKIIDEPSCIIKDIDTVDNPEGDDDDLLISEGKIQLVCKVSLSEFVKPMKSRCGHTFDDNSIRSAFNYSSARVSRQCLEDACSVKLTYPTDFKLDETMIFRVACSRINNKK